MQISMRLFLSFSTFVCGGSYFELGHAASSAVIWSQGPVELMSNYSYSIKTGSDGFVLRSGWFGITCLGAAVQVVPVSHSFKKNNSQVIIHTMLMGDTTKCKGVAVDFSVEYSANQTAVMFGQHFPNGLTISPNASSTSTTKSTVQPLPKGLATAFPWFGNFTSEASDKVLQDIGWLTWKNEQFFNGIWGTADKGPGTALPLVLFDADVPHGAGVVLSTLHEHFTEGVVMPPGEHSAAAGVLDVVHSLPRNYTTTFLLSLGSGGVTSIVMAWGATLQHLSDVEGSAEAGSALHRGVTQRASIPDVVSTKMGYWTDNEAYYDWYHWFPNVNKDGSPQDVLLELKRELDSKAIPIAYWQLDAYWYKLEIKPGCCVVDWHAVSDQFPHGLAWLSKQLKAPLLLYTDTWCADNVYRKEMGGNFTFMDGSPVHLSWFTGNTSNVVPADAYAFWKNILAQGLSQGMGAFEIDFLNYNFNLYERFTTEPGAFASWIASLDRAAVDARIPVQYCMALPQQILNTVNLHAVTTTRVSPDGGRPYFRGGAGFLLAAAVGLRPFKDNVWTNGTFPKGLADVVGAVLSMGPVGIADRVNTTNATLATMACTRDGTLLHPDRPATPVDSSYIPTAPAGSVMVTCSGPATSVTPTLSHAHATAAGTAVRWYIVVSSGVSPSQDAHSTHGCTTTEEHGRVGVGSGYGMHPSDLYPLPMANTPLFWWQSGGAACVEGQPAAQCLNVFTDACDGGFDAVAGDDTVVVYHVSPLLGSFVLLGEVSKIVPVAAARTRTIVVMNDHVAVTVVGAEGESVRLLYAKTIAELPSGTVLAVDITLPATGEGVLKLT